MLVLVLAAIQPRPEPDRDGVLKTQSAPAQDRRQNIYRYVQRPRGDMRPLLPAGMLELLQGCRICLRLKVGCFSTTDGVVAALPDGIAMCQGRGVQRHAKRRTAR